ncbi:MAG: hypothetical protein U5L96_17335 [Owenweeksia sp.]|nr:hypothetical protein [Owenweeksia sp.]
MNQIKDFFEKEKELLQLKAVRSVSKVLAQLISVFFIMILLAISLLMGGIWFGFYMGEIYNSFAVGFGISTLSLVFLLLIFIAFRKNLLIKPFTNMSVRQLTADSHDKDEDQKS